MDRIKADPSKYAADRISEMNEDDVKTLLLSLSRTQGIEPKEQNEIL